LAAGITTIIGKGMVNTLLPYMIQDEYNRERKEREFDAAFLENEYLKAVFFPQLGERLWSLYDKKAKKELLYKNDIFQPVNLAQLEKIKKHNKAALDYMEKAIDLKSDYRPLLVNYAELLILNGQYEQWIRYYEGLDSGMKTVGKLKMLYQPLRVCSVENGKDIVWKEFTHFIMDEAEDEAAVIVSTARTDSFVLNVSNKIEQDGCMDIGVTVMPRGATVSENFNLRTARKKSYNLSKLYIDIPFRKEAAKFYLPGKRMHFNRVHYEVDPLKNAGDLAGNLQLPFVEQIYVGNDEAGVDCFFASNEGWNKAEDNCIELIEYKEYVLLRIHLLDDEPEGYFRAVYGGRNWGVPVQMLCYSNPPEWTFAEALAIALPIGILPKPNDIGEPLEIMSGLWRVLDSFPIQDAVWHPYYTNQDIHIQGGSSIKISYYQHETPDEITRLFFCANTKKQCVKQVCAVAEGFDFTAVEGINTHRITVSGHKLILDFDGIGYSVFIAKMRRGT